MSDEPRRFLTEEAPAKLRGASRIDLSVNTLAYLVRRCAALHR